MSPVFYLPDTGEFFRKGKRCDYPHNSGYRWVFYLGRRTLAHIAAYHAMTGQWPAQGIEVDHKDRNPHPRGFAVDGREIKL